MCNSFDHIHLKFWIYYFCKEKEYILKLSFTFISNGEKKETEKAWEIAKKEKKEKHRFHVMSFKKFSYTFYPYHFSNFIIQISFTSPTVPLHRYQNKHYTIEYDAAWWCIHILYLFQLFVCFYFHFDVLKNRAKELCV